MQQYTAEYIEGKPYLIHKDPAKNEAVNQAAWDSLDALVGVKPSIFRVKVKAINSSGVNVASTPEVNQVFQMPMLPQNSPVVENAFWAAADQNGMSEEEKDFVKNSFYSTGNPHCAGDALRHSLCGEPLMTDPDDTDDAFASFIMHMANELVNGKGDGIDLLKPPQVDAAFIAELKHPNATSAGITGLDADFGSVRGSKGEFSESIKAQYAEIVASLNERYNLHAPKMTSWDDIVTEAERVFIEQVMPVPLVKLFAKTEVREEKDDPDKLRLIFLVSFLHYLVDLTYFAKLHDSVTGRPQKGYMQGFVLAHGGWHSFINYVVTSEPKVYEYLKSRQDLDVNDFRKIADLFLAADDDVSKWDMYQRPFHRFLYMLMGALSYDLSDQDFATFLLAVLIGWSAYFFAYPVVAFTRKNRFVMCTRVLPSGSLSTSHYGSFRHRMARISLSLKRLRKFTETGNVKAEKLYRLFEPKSYNYSDDLLTIVFKQLSPFLDVEEEIKIYKEKFGLILKPPIGTKWKPLISEIGEDYDYYRVLGASFLKTRPVVSDGFVVPFRSFREIAMKAYRTSNSVQDSIHYCLILIGLIYQSPGNPRLYKFLSDIFASVSSNLDIDLKGYVTLYRDEIESSVLKVFKKVATPELKIKLELPSYECVMDHYRINAKDLAKSLVRHHELGTRVSSDHKIQRLSTLDYIEI